MLFYDKKFTIAVVVFVIVFFAAVAAVHVSRRHHLGRTNNTKAWYMNLYNWFFHPSTLQAYFIRTLRIYCDFTDNHYKCDANLQRFR